MLLKKILHKLKIVKLVWLQDFDGQLYLTWITKTNPFDDQPACHVHPFFSVGYVVLKPDGTCSGLNETIHYIEKWKWY